MYRFLKMIKFHFVVEKLILHEMLFVLVNDPKNKFSILNKVVYLYLFRSLFIFNINMKLVLIVITQKNIILLITYL